MNEEGVDFVQTPERCLRFLSAFLHELRTPLASFGILADLLTESAGSRLGEQERRYCGNLQDVARDLRYLVAEVGELSQLLAGRATARPGDALLAALVEEAEAAVRPGAWERGVVVSGSMDPALPRTFRCDPERLQRLLGLILDVAVGQARSEVSYRLDLDGQGLRVVASSDGLPLPDVSQQALFEPFGEQLHAARPRGGRSLALPLARELARLLGGTLWAGNRGERPALDLSIPAAGV